MLVLTVGHLFTPQHPINPQLTTVYPEYPSQQQIRVSSNTSRARNTGSGIAADNTTSCSVSSISSPNYVSSLHSHRVNRTNSPSHRPIRVSSILIVIAVT